MTLSLNLDSTAESDSRSGVPQQKTADKKAVAVDVQGLTKRFGSFEAVRSTSFQVLQGESFGLLGPNGAGKSTLIRMLTTLLIPTSGEAWVSGFHLRRQSNKVRRSIGVIPQALTSDPELTALENLNFYARLYKVPWSRRRKLVHQILESVDLTEWKHKLVGTFSGGMRRRLEIGRALVHQPRVLFLDEPTTGLDPASRLAMWEMITKLKAQTGMTIFLTTHYMEEADQLCDRIAIFDHGQIIAMDTPENLKSSTPGDQVIEVRFQDVPQGWNSLISALPSVQEVEAQNGTFRIKTPDILTTISALAAKAQENSVTVSSLGISGNTLEDVFVQYTGRKLRDAAEKSFRREVRHLYK